MVLRPFRQFPLLVRWRRPPLRLLSTTSRPGHIPWFVSQEEHDLPLDASRQAEPGNPNAAPPLPEDTPDYLRVLHAELCSLPDLETSYLLVTRPLEPISGPPLPHSPPKGVRRRRGGTTAGIGIDMAGSGLWSWFILAQVKRGTEARGSISRVTKFVRKTLGKLTADDPSVIMPPRRRKASSDWVMLDAGDFAVHILSRDAREKWFPRASTLVHGDG